MFDAAELTGMQAAQEAHMMDECEIWAHFGTRDSYGQIIPSYARSVTTKCGLEMTGGEIMHAAEKTVIRYDATLRLPLTTTISQRDRIKIIKRFEVSITPLEYEIAAPLSIGPSGIVAYLREVTA